MRLAFLILLLISLPGAQQESVVSIESRDKDGNRLKYGAGFFVGPDIIVTNWHVLENAFKVNITLFGNKTPFTVLGGLARDIHHDLALIKIKEKKTFAWADTNIINPNTGDTLLIFNGNPGSPQNFTRGILDTTLESGGKSYLQITGPLVPGHSGSPVYKKGKLAGIYSLKVVGGKLLVLATPGLVLQKFLATGKMAALSDLPSFCQNLLPAGGAAHRDTSIHLPAALIELKDFEWAASHPKKKKGRLTLQGFSVTNKMDHNISHIQLGIYVYNQGNTPIEQQQVSLFDRGHLSGGMSRTVSSFKLKNIMSLPDQKVLYRILDFKVGLKIQSLPEKAPVSDYRGIAGEHEGDQKNPFNEGQIVGTPGYGGEGETKNYYFWSAASVVAALFLFVILLN